MIKEFTGKTLKDKYEVGEILRESKLGDIYHGTDFSEEKDVAIKILSPTFAVDESIVERFSLEARVISRLSHPNILNITDFGKDEDGNVFIVMEDIEGETLKESIKRDGAFSPERAVKIAKQIASALSAMHENGIVHKSLTSKNILISEMSDDSELVKVLGVGEFNNEEDVDFQDIRLLEDLAYRSPEQCAEESEADERSDIYSLGIIFYEMLTGEVPFESDDATALMLKQTKEPPPAFSAFREDIPNELEIFTIRALAKSPESRFQTADEFVQELDEAVQEVGEGNSIVIPKVDAAVANSGAKNNLWKTAFILLAGVSILSFGLIYWTNTKKTEPLTTQNTFEEEGRPVKPLNPATGLSEQSLQTISNQETGSLDPNAPLINPNGGGSVGGTTGGGGGYDPWANPGSPPKGSRQPQQIGPGGDYVDGSTNPDSPFVQDQGLYDKDGNRIIIVPKIVVDEPTKKQPETKTGAKSDKQSTEKDPKTGDKPKTDKPKNDKGNKVDKNTPKKPEKKVEPKKNEPKNKNTKGKKAKKTLPKQPIAKNATSKNEG